MTMTSNEKRMLEREALRSVIQQWNANRLDLFELSEPDENLQFHGVMRFYFQDHGQKVATKCIRVASDATVSDVIETLIEKFRPDMRMLSLPSYALYEVHSNGEERKLNPDEKPLLVQLNWHIDDREGRFLLRDTSQKTNILENSDLNFKRKLSKREKKEQKKKEKLAKLNSTTATDAENHVAEKLYNELPETSFTRSISNPEAVMRRRRQQILEKKLQQFRSRDGGPDTGGTLKIYGESLCRDVPYKTLLLSIRDCAQAVVREMLAKYGLDKTDPLHYCLVQVNSDGTEYILDDDECPLSILMNHPTSRGSIMFHVRRRPADSQPRRRKKKPLGVSNGSNNVSVEREGPMLVEITHSGDGGRRVKLSAEPVEVGSANTNPLQLFGPSIQPRHCLISLHEGVCTVTPLHADALTFVNGHHIQQPTILHNGSVVMFGRVASYRFVDSPSDGRYNLALSQSQLDSACLYERTNKVQGTEIAGQEPILPAVLEFPETHQETFLQHVISELDVNVPNFKLAPVYTLYLCARYRASTHYRPDLQPTERAHKLTVFLHHVAKLIFNIIQEQYQDPKMLSFWMANSSEFLHFLKSDRHISAFSVQAQEVLAESVQTAFRNLVNCFRIELSQTLNQFLSENIDHDSAAGLVLTVLGSAMALLRRCRVNAALTIQLFSQLFHYINCVCFNTIVTNPHMCIEAWGKVISDRLRILEVWALRQGLELAADCHLAKINQCAKFLQSPKSTEVEVKQLARSCFRLNSLQMAALLSQEKIPNSLMDTAISMAESVADELTRSDGREVCLEESPDLPLALLIPDDGFSCDVVRGIPAGLVDFVSHLQAAGMCRLAAQPTSIGLWTVYMHQYNVRSSSAMSSKLPQPEVQVIKLHKNSNGMGLSIVAAKGAGQERLGIYIKSVVPGGAADADGRLQAGDQLLKVDGQSLIGITQERAADYLVRTGPIVTLEVAKQGAIYHGLATLLQQPSPVIQRGNRRMSERDITRLGVDSKPPLPIHGQQQLPNSKSVPTLHHVGGSSVGGGVGPIGGNSGNVPNMANASNKSRSINNLTGDQSFYQNLSVYRNQSQPNLGERGQIMLSQSTIISPNSTTTSLNQQQQQQQQQILNRPASAYFNNTNNAQQQTQQHQHQHQHQQQPNQMMMTGQQNLRMNQMMAPSMPNIAHASGYPNNMSASQSMQNVNMINPGAPLSIGVGPNYHHSYGPQQMPSNQMSSATSHPHIYHPQDLQHLQHQQHHQQQQLQLQQHQNQSTLLRGQGKLSDMNEMLKRRHQRQSEMMPMHALDGHHQPQLSPVKQLPPTAPKPQPNRQPQQMYKEQELSPPLPPTATHPLFKTATTSSIPSTNNVINSGAPPPPPPAAFDTNKMAYYQGAAAASTGNLSQQLPPKNFGSSSNPWEREEREKEQEYRREQIRQWRDLQINEMAGQQHRTPQQDEQLKTLVLERDFERRAQESDEQDDDNDVPYAKEGSVQEMMRLGGGAGGQQLSPSTKQDSQKMPSSNDSTMDFPSYPLPQQSQQLLSNSIQPKSILKHNINRLDEKNISNPSSPSKQAKSASFADDRMSASDANNSTISSVARDLSNLSFNNYEMTNNSNTHQDMTRNKEQIVDGGFDVPPQMQPLQATLITAPPPPPPERNSSYVIMSQKQQQTLRTSTGGPLLMEQQLQQHQQLLQQQQQQQQQYQSQMSGQQGATTNLNYLTNKRSTSNNNNGNQQNNVMPTGSVTHMSLTQMLANRDRDKRVSFHDEDNNFIGATTAMMAEQAEMDIIREDANRYSADNSVSSLQSPTTPDNESWNSTAQPTPGVIGAQEVYRDPRTRRLQEKQQQQQQQKAGEVPEKLSFKEKMKMFALESGENQTPKDKLKISRAQRDIDAVH